MAKLHEQNDPYFIDFPARVSQIQKEMAREGIDVYLGSRLRTLSWISDAFCPWRSYVVVPPEGLPTVFTFVIDAARIIDESWLDEDHVLGYAPMGGMDQITIIADHIKAILKGKRGRVGFETGLSNYLPEGNLTHFEYEAFHDALEGNHLVN
ncbi:MAG TPA: aminopeptidase P family N-terminal domain-containing protein, partial [Deltaproteobacteria bacterium]|nr:aminopeptidase P family N-terminal domain-containing protein [Deltaproteobacteria bacterium]